MPECAGNYNIPTANGNVEGADTPAGAGILNFLNIYVQQTSVNAPHDSVDNSQLYIKNCHPNCQFADLTYTGRCYWYRSNAS